MGGAGGGVGGAVAWRPEEKRIMLRIRRKKLKDWKLPGLDTWAYLKIFQEGSMTSDGMAAP